MRTVLGVFLFVLGAGCAHAPEKTERVEEPAAQQTASAPAPAPRMAADPQELSRKADAAYKELNFPACAEHFRQAAEAHTDEASRADAFYGAACCASLAGDHAKAVGYLERAVQSGYVDVGYLQTDPELSPLHSLPGWKAVVAGAQANFDKAPDKPRPVPTLAAVDVYGSKRAEPDAVRRMLGYELGKPIAMSSVLVKKQEEALRKQYNLAFAKVSFISYFAGPEADRAYLTVDLVDAEDAKRAEFLPAPTGQTQDPEGLVAQWLAYEQKAWQLMNRGQLDPAKHSVCRVAHCALGFGHPELAPFEPAFVEKVPAAQDAVAQVLRQDADERERAAAAYLLAYAASSEKAVERLLPSIRDPSYLVRNNVLRVLMGIQQKADRPLMDVAVVVDALSMPTTTDRNKGLYLLKALLEKMKPEELKAQRAPLTRQLGAQLVELAALRQPNNRDPARDVLKLISGEKYETPEQWKSWLERQKK
jgi:hypothetical protein